MRKMKNDNGYNIIDTSWGYYIVIGSTKHNKMITYEYDGCCGTHDEVEKFLKENTFSDIVKAFRDQCVYVECVEQIY